MVKWPSCVAVPSPVPWTRRLGGTTTPWSAAVNVPPNGSCVAFRECARAGLVGEVGETWPLQAVASTLTARMIGRMTIGRIGAPSRLKNDAGHRPAWMDARVSRWRTEKGGHYRADRRGVFRVPFESR